jgi:hypothetical protein
MVALICFVLAVLAVLASPFKSNSRLEVENAGTSTSADHFAAEGERQSPPYEQ